MTFKLPLAWLFAAALASTSAMADDSHDHGAAPVAAAAPVLPRFASSSELFELVGVANGKFISLYLDRFVDNEPVRRATIELDVGGVNVAVKEVAPGEYEGELSAALEPGLTAVTAMVTVGSDTDLFAGDLVMPAALAMTGPAAGRGTFIGWGAGVLALLAVLGLVFRRSAAGRASAGGAA